MEEKQIRAVFFPEDGQWVGQCLEYDICAQAASLEEVHYRLMLTLAAERAFSLKAGREAFDGIVEAPPHFFAMYEGASGTWTPSSSLAEGRTIQTVKLAA